MRCSSRASSGGRTRAAARPGRLLCRWGPLARDQAHPPPLEVRTHVAACIQAEAQAHVVPDLAGGLRWRGAKIHWRNEAQSEYKQISKNPKSGGATLGILGGGDSTAAARRLCRAVRGVPAAPFYGWMVAVSGTSKINGLEQGVFVRPSPQITGG